MADADDLRDASPWHPMVNPVDIKHIGKFIEELGECVSAAARALIQGVTECEPVTGKPNKEWLEDEIADIEANIALCVVRFKLSVDSKRRERKKRHLKQWHDMA
jgi:hypothetical protein